MTTTHRHVPSAALTLVSHAAVIGLAAVLVASCSGDGSITAPTVSRSRTMTASPTTTIEQPAPTRTENRPTTPTRGSPPSSASSSVSSPSSTTSAPRPTLKPSSGPTPTSKPSTATVTATASPQPTSPAPASSTVPSPSTTTLQPAAGAEAQTSGAPSWLWWLLGALAVAAAIAVPLLLRRRRQAWEAELAAAEDDVIWLARDLLPQLRMARTADQVRGGWAVSAERVTTAEDRLTALEATARREQDRTRARALRDVVRASRDRIQAVASGAVADPSAELGRVATDLEAALAVSPPTTPPAQGQPS
jgi:hypothetical protein